MNSVPRKWGHGDLPFPGESFKHHHVLVFVSYLELNHIYHQKQSLFYVVNKLSQLEQHCLIKLLKKKQRSIFSAAVVRGRRNTADTADKDTERFQ